jgi:putative PIG3 family NAD(P)H quinone oxidoreductase
MQDATEIPYHYWFIDQPGAGASLHWRSGFLAHPKARQMLVAVEAVGLNRADLYQYRGQYPLPPGANPVLGLELSGRVIAVGSQVRRFATGDAICALVDGGAYATHALVEEGLCFAKPESLSWAKAAALPEALMTGWMALWHEARLRPGEWLLMDGVSGGIGPVIAQMAKQAGAKVLATVGSNEKAQQAEALGVIPLRYDRAEMVAHVKAATAGRGVDVILDMVGGARVEQNLAMLAHQGRMVTIALQGGAEASVPLGRLLVRQLRWSGAMLRPRAMSEKRHYALRVQEKFWPLVKNSGIQPIIGCVRPLAEAETLLQAMEQRTVTGKAVLQVQQC